MVNILKHGRGDERGEGAGDHVMICIQCGKRKRLTYRPKGQYSDGAYLCGGCKCANEKKNKEQFLEDAKRVMAHPDNRETVERSKKMMEERKKEGRTRVDPERLEQMKKEQRRRR